ncbi:hypothetical protein [Alienimonas californiensis]|uniref:Uncharacterized protein n=1 Tax=Alienimonas californiensis TaxID=2527989 RepID=A0A517PCK2_9PLAN|nr:hypothetical protein [Alienimonas californiensis]QDT17113.1 hypothetical protein CA12_32250 [Alienimonas californiensis]
MSAPLSRPGRERHDQADLGRGRSKWAATALLTVAAASLCVVGCRNLAEQRAVRRFGDALSEESLAALSDATTDNFRGKALEHDTAMEDLRLLRLPKEELKVVAVTDVPEEEWKSADVPECLVIVETPPPTRRARFKLVRAEAGQWLVDDVLLKQTKGGVKAVMSVTEQLELLAAVRGFTRAWGKGTHDERLAVVTPELREDLSALSPKRLEELAGWVVDADRVDKLTPKTQMDAEEAAVQFAGRGYTLLVSLEKRGDAWLVKDAAAENRGLGPKIPSLERTCLALTGVSNFLTAYESGNREGLESTVFPELYNGCLRTADLSGVPLPTAADLDGESSFQIHGDRAEVVVTTEAGVYTLSLTDPHRYDADRRTGEFLVEEVTIRNGDGEQRMLSTIFTARAAVAAFAAAAAEGDLHALTAASTRDLSETVWSQIEPTDLPALPLADAAAAANGKVLAERHAGPVTEITIVTAVGDRTFVLKEEGGASKVDDVLAPSLDLPESFKDTCALILPARAFAGSLAQGDLPGLNKTSSAAFNRLVWHQLRSVPAAASAAGKRLDAPLAKATTLTKGEGARCTLHYGTPNDGLELHLVREKGRLVVDDVELVAGVHPDARVALKQVIREQMAGGDLRIADSFAPAKVPQAGAQPMSPAPAGAPTASRVRTVGYEEPAEGETTMTAEAPGDPQTAADIVRNQVRQAHFKEPAPAEAVEAVKAVEAAEGVEPPPAFETPGAIRPLPSSIAPAKGVDGGAAAPFGEPLPLGGE